MREAPPLTMFNNTVKLHVTKNAMYSVYVFMQRRLQNSHVIITQLRKPVVPPLTQAYPGAKVRVITREARYYAKTRAFASFYAFISRAHAARAVT